ncbi:hypothetical protein [Microbacterium sp. Marseille-Q6965]|uniref:hypothetical protein n=1 Tax=Microbacterium sp. Marseille-Q6965 TaxID=2965072 RepID=UPI0021B6EB03|nr:hypothetical protein [Microbacterium sp. Marseille-Q6965]
MSTLASAAPVHAPHVPATGSRLTFGGLVKAEWISLTSLRGTHLALWIGAALAFGLTAGMSFIYGLSTTRDDNPMPIEGVPPLSMAILNGYIVAIAVAVVLGAAAYAKEHATGSLRTQLAAAPRRVPTLGAKAVVVGGTLFVFAAAGFALCLAACAGIYAAFDMPTNVVDAVPELVLPVLGIALGTALAGVFALGLSAMLRSETWSITLTFVFIFVLPTLLYTLPWEWAQRTSEYLLGTTIQELPDTTGGLAGDYLTDLAVTVAWVVAAFVGGALVMHRRDA